MSILRDFLVKKKIVAAIVTCVLSSASYAENVAKKQARSFYKMYSSLCAQRLANLDDFRKELQSLPQLPAQKAKRFLAGQAGQAWSIPDEHGLFVLVLPKAKKICSIHARRADTKLAQKLFIDFISKAPAPLVSKKIQDNKKSTSKGIQRTIRYEWVKPNAPLVFVFMLSTNSDTEADLQVLGTAAVVKK